MQTPPDRSERTLELLHAAMRARDAAPAGSPAWRSADEQAQAIREAYLRLEQASGDEPDDDDDLDRPADSIRVR